MWALPDIHRLNEEASREAARNKNRTEKQLCRGQTCEECSAKAVHAHPYYDVFGDDPKGYVFQCEKHYNRGMPEGYFYCDRCNQDFIENYTWEYYFRDDPETCERLCLNCAFDKEIENPDNWIASIDQLTWEKVRQAKHLIPVAGEHWKEKLLFIGNTELDSMTGAKITGFDSTSSREDGLKELRGLVERALGYNAMKHLLKSIPGSKTLEDMKIKASVPPRCILIIDGTYQFATSIGVYIDRWDHGPEGKDEDLPVN